MFARRVIPCYGIDEENRTGKTTGSAQHQEEAVQILFVWYVSHCVTSLFLFLLFMLLASSTFFNVCELDWTAT